MHTKKTHTNQLTYFVYFQFFRHMEIITNKCDTEFDKSIHMIFRDLKKYDVFLHYRMKGQREISFFNFVVVVVAKALVEHGVN